MVVCLSEPPKVGYVRVTVKFGKSDSVVVSVPLFNRDSIWFRCS